MFIIYIVIQKQEKMFMHSKKPVLIRVKTLVETLLFDKILIVILIKYFNYINIFLEKNTIELLKYIKKNNHVIKLKKDK